MKKAVFLLIVSVVYAFGDELYSDTISGFYIQTASVFNDKNDKMLGAQSAEKLTGKRKNINEFDVGLYVQNDRSGFRGYGSLWFGNANQYGVGWGLEGKYKPSQHIPISLVLGFDEKIGLGDDVFEVHNVTLAAVNAGAPTMIYFDDNTEFKSIALKFGIEFDISKRLALSAAYMPRWDNYKVKYREMGSSIVRKAHEAQWYEFHSAALAGVILRF
ncbi:MAG: hypothetical protein LBB59_08345 [Campylobacteraceae bacterium]|jgi:hypothetical protein|nr:hypothetical protein [Campylobacteraceae bacterium]